MKFSDMKYSRPDGEGLKARMAELTERLRSAGSYQEAREVFLEQDRLSGSISTAAQLAHIRHTIDTRDKFYDGEENWWNNFGPVLEEYAQQWRQAMLASPFRADFEEEYGELMFISGEMALKTFSPEIIPLLQKENEEAAAYEKLLAGARVEFEGGVYTLSQMEPFKNDPDDGRRLAAWKAEGKWYKDNQAALDAHYDKLVALRDETAKKLGYENYIELGYYRLSRNCYTKEDVEGFRKSVVKYLVPLAEDIYRAQAARLGKSYPMNYADNALNFHSGNPKPAVGPEQILEHGLRFYNELSPETGEFFRAMMDNRLLDVLSTEGKATGGYCTEIPDYKSPFIFANFNGTQHDIDVITHEAGHAFQVWLNRNRIPLDYHWPSMEACEVHSMSMEFFAWPWAEGFFGKDTKKHYYSHIAGAIKFIPYGALVDHFQHEVYANPGMTPRQRHDKWKQLQQIYMPWVRLDGEIPFYSEGEAWQRQHHIYSSPFYYIDYCLAQTVALGFWAMIQKDIGSAWGKYMDYTLQGGSDTFTNMLKKAGLDTPFEEACLRDSSAAAKKWMDGFDLSEIE